jgi:uncharacterized protein (TIGR00369 family)
MTDTPNFPTSPMRLGGDAPQAVAIGLRFISADGGVAVAELPWRADLVGDVESGALFGGAVVTMLDHIGGSSVFSALLAAGATDVASIATLDLRVDHVRPSRRGETLTGRASCYRVTPTVAFVRAAAFETDEADPVATVQAAFAVNRA